MKYHNTNDYNINKYIYDELYLWHKYILYLYICNYYIMAHDFLKTIVQPLLIKIKEKIKMFGDVKIYF